MYYLGEPIASVKVGSPADYERCLSNMENAKKVFAIGCACWPLSFFFTHCIISIQYILFNLLSYLQAWAALPAPKRGDIVRQLGNEFRRKIVPIGRRRAFPNLGITTNQAKCRVPSL